MNIFLRVRELAVRVAGTETALAERIGLTQQKINRYINSRSPLLWDYLPAILGKYPEVSREWLYFGEGEMFRSSSVAVQPAPPPRQDAGYAATNRSIPIIGLASCGVEGIEQVMPNVVASSPIALGPRGFGVSAYGSSLVPLGISNVHVCYCDPDLDPVVGEVVFVRTRDNRGTLKLFLGEGSGSEMFRFRGWLEPDRAGRQKEFNLDLLKEIIDCIAPVVFIRRRM